MNLVDVPFDIPNIRCEVGKAPAHTRIGWFRSVSNIPHGFAQQCMVAEIAHQIGKDPKDFLLEIIGPARIVDTSKTHEELHELRRSARNLPERRGAAAQCDQYRRETGRLGAVSCRPVAAWASRRCGCS